MTRFKILVLIILLSSTCRAQVTPCSDVINSIIESFSDEINSDESIDALAQLYTQKIDLNKITIDELALFPFLSQFDINHILEYREMSESFADVLELQQCDLSLEKAKMLSCFTTAGDLSLKLDDYSSKHLVTLTTKKQDAFNNIPNKYEGNLWNSSLRYRGRFSSNLQVAYTGEKDAGEKLLSNKSLPFDFNSLSIELRNTGFFSHLIVGDYTLNFGEGLTHGAGLGFSKSALVLKTLRAGNSVRPYRSITENGFQRGICLTKKHRFFKTTFWVSKAREDGSIVSSSDDNVTYTSFLQTGLHRSKKELLNKNAIPVNQTGLNLQYLKPSLSFGLTWNNTRIDAIKLDKSTEFTPFSFSEDRFHKIGFNYRLNVKNALIYGESTVCSNLAAANVIGGLISLSRHTSLVIHHRSLSRQFIPLYTNAFTEYSTGNNETGTYVGLEIKYNKRWIIRSYNDFYKRNGISFNAISPTSGSDLVCEVQHSPSKQLLWYIRLKCENKDQPTKNNDIVNTWLKDRLFRTRFHLQYTPTRNISLKTRFEKSNYTKANNQTSGSLLYQDIAYKFNQANISLKLRFAMSNIEDFSNRIYTYENDVAYSYSLPFYSDNKLRTYALINIKTRNRIEVWFRCSIDNKTIRKSIGYEVNSVSSPSVLDLTFQLRYHL